MRNTQFSSVGAGEALCALDAPSTTVGEIRSAVDCAQSCAHVEGCVSVNYLATGGGTRSGMGSCAMYLSAPSNFAAQTGCRYYKVLDYLA